MRLESARRAGFTIVELVIAFIIIGILTAILVPTLTNRSAEARIRAANQDLQGLADAEERAAIDTGYFLRPSALNDVAGFGDGVANDALTPGVTPFDHIQSIIDNSNTITHATGMYLQQYAEALFIVASSQSYLGLQQENTLFSRLISNPPKSESDFNFHGPYLNWYHDVNHNDWPDDPWGNDYLFFTRTGVIYPPDPARNITDHTYNPNPDPNVGYLTGFYGEGPLTTLPSGGSKAYPAFNVFDRPTFLSLGPNGVPGNGTTDPNDGYGQGDDIVRSFGGGN